MKILMITTVRFRQNGITSVILNYYNNLINKVDKIDIVGPNEIDDIYKQLFSQHDSKYFKLSNRKKNIFQYIILLYNLIKKENYDIVHIHGSSHLISLELFVATMARVKVKIAHSHNTRCDHVILHNMLTPIFNVLYTHPIACSYQAGQWMFGKKDFEIINNGIDLDKYRYCNLTNLLLRKELDIKSDTYIIGNIAGFLPVKNHAFLIELAEKLQNKGVDNFKFILLGDGELFKATKLLIAKKNLGNFFIFFGNKKNVENYYSLMDLFILPSLYEGFPMVLVEAQANGLNCLVSNTITEKTNITGLVEYKNLNCIETWVDYIEESKRINNDRDQKSENAQKILIKNNYSSLKNAEYLLKLYNTACNQEEIL